mmetsp:Transcript_11437/g.24469  ORF Transcript_11437/g.24469 Transcript_11437/m.24469 type:complete len:115 (-) Transcript_11437:609-953(-)
MPVAECAERRLRLSRLRRQLSTELLATARAHLGADARVQRTCARRPQSSPFVLELREALRVLPCLGVNAADQLASRVRSAVRARVTSKITLSMAKSLLEIARALKLVQPCLEML